MKNQISTIIKLTLKSGDEKFFGPGIAELMERIDQDGSVKDACRDMGLSYSKGRAILKRAEQCMGCELIATKHGGQGGGASSLTENARQLLLAYRRTEAEVSRFAEAKYRELSRRKETISESVDGMLPHGA